MTAGAPGVRRRHEDPFQGLRVTLDALKVLRGDVQAGNLAVCRLLLMTSGRGWSGCSPMLAARTPEPHHGPAFAPRGFPALTSATSRGPQFDYRGELNCCATAIKIRSYPQ